MAKASFSRALVWTLIAAAFIGPGTVTTAARAGSEGGWYYTPYVLLAAGAGFLLMEMVARITLVSGRSLGKILGWRGRWLAALCFGAVLLGCMAYQAGNLLGALGGIQLLFPVNRWWVLALGGLAFGVLWPGDTRLIARALASIVSLMGIIFVVAAATLVFGGAELGGGGVVVPATVVGLIGTTIVPYNFFLAAGLSKGQALGSMRSGLLGSFVVGGLITLSIILVGSAANAFTTFPDLARTLEATLGQWSSGVLGGGLFAAGFSSAVTAPLAAALAGRELLGGTSLKGNRGRGFRLIWGGVLLVGLLVACLDLDIVGVILAAQIANGLLLPLIAAIVLVLANDRKLLLENVNAWWQNILGLAVAAFLAQKSFRILLEKAGWDVWDSLPTFLATVYLLALGWLIFQRRRSER